MLLSIYHQLFEKKSSAVLSLYSTLLDANDSLFTKINKFKISYLRLSLFCIW